MRYAKSFEVRRHYFDKRPSEFVATVHGERNARRVIKDLSQACINEPYFYLMTELKLEVNQ